MAIQKISHGAANWDSQINANFDQLTADTGKISVPLINGFGENEKYPETKASLFYQIVGNLMILRGQFYRSNDVSTRQACAILPKIEGLGAWQYSLAYVNSAKGFTNVVIDNNGQLLIAVDSNDAIIQINSIFVINTK